MMDIKKTLLTVYQDTFREQPPIVIRAPGRINIIGEHTDYNDGFVLPTAIQLGIWIALRPRNDLRIVLHSLDYEPTTDFSLHDFGHVAHWGEYVRGVAWVLKQHNLPISGWEGVITGNIPTGAGLSSSAALEMAILKAFWSVSDWPWEGKEMALLAQEAENRWVGVQSGVMDQMIVALGKEHHALFLDCRSLDHTWVPLIEGTQFLILDTGTRRELVESIYNQRVDQCQAAADFFGVDTLREVSLAELDARANELDELLFRRARHVVSENERTRQAAGAMEAGDKERLGQLLNASHDSLRDDYEVSSPELDAMVNLARKEAGTYGARMTGAGFGGAALAIVRSEVSTDIAARIHNAYTKSTGLTPHIYPCLASRGAERVDVPSS